MCTIAEMLRRVRSADLVSMTGDIIEENPEAIRQLNLKQLMEGKNNKGELLSPKHSENPWFKKPGAGLRYAAWKKKLFPETPFDIPNLKINGYYHDSISVQRMGNTIQFAASASFAGSIDQTFNNSPLGLNEQSKETAYNQIIRSLLVHRLAGTLGVSVSE